MLIDSMMTSCVLVEKKRAPDGEGGFFTSWTDGAQFDAAITLDQSLQARVAEKDGVTSVYTVTTHKRAALDYHDVFKRLSDGAIFRVTSNGADKQSPKVSSLDIAQASAERWELTT